MSDSNEPKEEKEYVSILELQYKRWHPKYYDDPRYKVIPNAEISNDGKREKIEKIIEEAEKEEKVCEEEFVR